MPDEDTVPEHGIGFEIFHQMKLRKNEVSQYIVETDESVTIGELLDASTRVAISLKKLNLADDAIIAISSWSHKQTCIPYIAGLFNGNIVTFLDPLVTPKDKALMFEKVTPSILFVDEDNLGNIEESLKLGGLDIKIVVFEGNKNGYISLEEFSRVTDSEVEAFEPVKLDNNERTAVIIFSSGTTGVPKGISLSHLGILSRTGGFSIPVTIILSAPNWISYCLLLIRSLREGGARVLGKNYDLSQIWRLVDKYKINMMLASIYQCSQMIKQPIEDGLDISSLGLLITGGASMPPEIFSRLKQVVPNVLILQAYGLTEACGPTLVFDLGLAKDREFHKKKPDSCGTPIPGVWYKVVDPETEEILGPNKPGELRIKSRYSMLGYYNEDSSKDFDSDGYLKTGDILQYDEDLCFFVIDRLKEMLKYRGFIWSPTELENALITHPFVEIAAVVGVPHIEDGDLPMCLVKLRENCQVDPDELVEHVNNILKDERKKLRAGVKIVKDLPLTGTGKIHKKKIREMILDGQI
ncbi:4-coumarate--CoA ligase 1-like isoform X2 [Coccinella septempunctata]|nr:4-coumarate--CoA ligase 1-like isoform X2 [Coccinella septempunctata]